MPPVSKLVPGSPGPRRAERLVGMTHCLPSIRHDLANRFRGPYLGAKLCHGLQDRDGLQGLVNLLKALGGSDGSTKGHHRIPSLFAVASPVVRLLTPGPDVAIATPALPVSRPIPPAMKAAFCSWRHTTVSIEEDFSVSKTLSIFAPGMPNTCVTPCRSSDSTTICAPDLEVFELIVSSRDPRFPVYLSASITERQRLVGAVSQRHFVRSFNVLRSSTM